MKENDSTGQEHAINAFLECVARCLAKRWLKIQRGRNQIDVCSEPEKTPTTEEHPFDSKLDDGALSMLN